MDPENVFIPSTWAAAIRTGVLVAKEPHLIGPINSQILVSELIDILILAVSKLAEFYVKHDSNNRMLFTHEIEVFRRI